MFGSTQTRWISAMGVVFLTFALAAPADAALKVHTSKRNPKASEKPGDGEEDKPWTAAGLDGSVEIEVKRGHAFYVGIENGQVLTNTKTLTLTLTGEGVSDFKYKGSVGVYEYNGKDRQAKGKKTGRTDSADGDPESVTFTIQFPVQPEWESVKIVNRGAGGTFDLTIGGDSECAFSEKNANKYTHNASYGAEGAMVDDLAITAIAIYPEATDVDPDEPAFLEAAPETGPWSMVYTLVDPTGGARPHGGLMWTSEGLGLAAGQEYTIDFGMFGEADDIYTIYAYDSMDARWLRFRRDTRPMVVGWRSVRQHGADVHGIDLVPADGRLDFPDEEEGAEPTDPYELLPAPETREGVVHTIEVAFDQPVVLIDPTLITVTNGVETLPIDNVQMVSPTLLSFEQAAMPQLGDHVRMNIDGAFGELGGAVTSYFVQGLGDVDGSLETNASDAAAIADRAGEVVVEDNAPYDLNQNGFVELDDMLIATNAEGIAPMCNSELTSTTWLERFDGEDAGTNVDGLGGWKGWDGDAAFAAATSGAQSSSGHASIEIAGGADVVRELHACGGGAWSFSAWQYIPADFAVGGGGQLDGSYFILLNTYQDGGPYDWSVQIQADSNDGMLKVLHGDGANTIDVPYVTDEWKRIEAIIDLENDWTQIYYDDALVAEYSWTGGVLGDNTGVPDIAAVDLFANGSTSIYYDDLQLVRIPAVDPCPEDLTGDGGVGFQDLVLLLSSWGECPGCPADLDGDGSVAFADLIALLAVWGPCA